MDTGCKRTVSEPEWVTVKSEPMETVKLESVETVKFEPMVTVKSEPVETMIFEPVVTVKSEPVETVKFEPVVTVKSEPVDEENEEMFISDIKIEPVDIKLESEVDIHEEFPDRILPDSPDDEVSESGYGMEIPFVQGVKSNVDLGSAEGPSSSVFFKTFGQFIPPSNAMSAINIWPKKNSIIEFRSLAEIDDGIKNIPDADSNSNSGTECNFSVVKLENGDTEVFKCDICGDEFNEVTSVEEHMCTVHSEEKPHKREDGGKKFQETIPQIEQSVLDYKTCSEKLGQNSNTEIRESALDMKSKPHECLLCGKIFNLKGSLKFHINCYHKREDPLQCSHCGKMFSSKSVLRMHIITAHKMEKPYECEYCMKTFGRNNEMNRHIKAVHKKEQPYECQYCGKKFGRRHHAKRHVNTVHKNEYL